MAIYTQRQEDIDSLELARRLFTHVICISGVSENIITNCGTQCTSQFWLWVGSDFSTDHRLSTPIHPLADAQTERRNQIMEQYLQAFCNYKQDN